MSHALDFDGVRRLPVYLLLDCSGSMAGEPVAAMAMGLEELISSLKKDPFARQAVWLSVIKFSSRAQLVLPLTEIGNVGPVSLEAAGSTALGGAFTLLTERLNTEVIQQTPRSKGDWLPLVYLFTDGQPTDSLEPVEAFRKKRRAAVVACGAGPDVDEALLRQIGDKTFRLSDTSPGKLRSFMTYVSMSLARSSRSLGSPAQWDEAFAVPEHSDFITVS